MGDFECLVQTITPTQITCRVEETSYTGPVTSEVMTFLRTFEEAVNDVSNVYEFLAPAATVTGLTGAFSEASNEIELTLTGSGFGTTSVGVELWIDGVKQLTNAVADTEATFTLTHLKHESANSVKIYFPDGLPSGHESVANVEVTPNLVSIAPASGFAGGTLITVTGTGFGMDTQGLTLELSTGTNICSSVEILAYGVFTCMTKAM